MTKEYAGFLATAIEKGAVPVGGRVTIPNIETYKIGDNYIKVGKEIVYEWAYAEGADVHEANMAMNAYADADAAYTLAEHKQAKGIGATVAPQLKAEQAATVAQNGAEAEFGPPAGETVADPAKAPSGLESPVPVEVVKFTLARRTDKKFQLELWQMYGSKVGKYPEIKYVAEQGDMWTMIGHLVEDKDFSSMPVEYDVSWTAIWEHGREFTRDDGSKGNYKDLEGLKQR